MILKNYQMIEYSNKNTENLSKTDIRKSLEMEKGPLYQCEKVQNKKDTHDVIGAWLLPNVVPSLAIFYNQKIMVLINSIAADIWD